HFFKPRGEQGLLPSMPSMSEITGNLLCPLPPLCLSASQNPLKRCSGARLSPGVGRLERSIGLDKLVQWNQLTL
ncbi:unnamed protein product, partial [Musa acuminata subsp. burmannicoides]